MRISLPTRLFKSRVGRRIVLLFLLCAVLPAGTFAAIGYWQVGTKLRDESESELERGASAAANALVERLMLVDAQLAVVGSSLDDIAMVGARSLAIRRPDGSWDVSVADTERARLFRFLASVNAPGLWIEPPVPGEPWIALAGNDARVVAVLGPEFLWGTAETYAALSTTATFCVLGPEKRPLHCPAGLPDGLARALPEAGTVLSEVRQWSGPGEDLLVGWRSVFLLPEFGAPAWEVVLTEHEGLSLAALSDFRRTFLLTIALGISLVALLSQIQIRRSLEPLDTLRSGTESMKEGQFWTRVDLSSGDEFEDLAESFNQMAERLGGQFDMLRLLGALDRAALSSTQVQPFLASVFQHVPIAFPSHRCRIALIRPGASSPEALGADGWLFRQQEELPFVEGNVRLTAEDCRTLVAADRWSSGFGPPPAYLRDPFAEGLEDSSWLLCPIIRENRPLGALIVERDRAERFAEEEYTKARQVADQIGLGLASIQASSALEEASSGALLALARSVDAASPWTSGHSERVATVSVSIGKEIGLSSDQLGLLRRGGLLHDIGKLGVSSEILDKAGRLTADEVTAIRRHPEIGARILEPIAAFKELLPMVLHHHERFDGGGYPSGLFRNEIPELARVMAAADAFDAMTSDRPYREGLSMVEASDILTRGAGSQFDPLMAEALTGLIRRNDPTVLARSVSPELHLHRPASVLAYRG